MLRTLLTLPAVLTLALGLHVATPALAQTDVQRLRDAIEVTDRRIELATELITASPNPRARAELDQAIALQALAKQAFAEARYAAAGRATMDARIHADRAIAILRGLPDPGRVEEQLQRTRELIERARDRLAGCELRNAREMLRTAVEMQQRAEQAYRETRYLAALQLTMSARERALRALRLCNADESREDIVATAIQRTDEVLARAHEVVDANGSERARRLLANADSLQSRAKSEAAAGHLGLALRLTRQARDQATRAARASAPSATR